MSMPSHLQFPPELWTITAQNFRHRKTPDELTYLWTTVRQVSRQFKEEIEDIFCTEHLPKTWLHLDTATMYHNPPTGAKVYDFKFKLNFDKIQPRYPGRAVFSLPSQNNGWVYQGPEISAYRRNTCKRLRDKVGPGRLGEADKSVPGSRIRLFESPVGMFVVQVRGSVGDCALPGLNIDPSRSELSFEWRDCFTRFFGERKLAMATLHGEPMDKAPAHTRDHYPTQQSSAALQEIINLDPNLQVLAQRDWYTHLRHMQISREGINRIQRLKNPIQTWTDAIGDELGQAKATLRRRLLRRHADQEIDLDDEGAISQARIDWDTESNQAAVSKGSAEWYTLTRACDACRTMNKQCEREDAESGLPRDCKSCIESGSPCDSSLACLSISRPHYVSRDYQMQLMLLEQQNKKRLVMARQEQANYQMQLMLLEQQNKKRLVMARQEQATMGQSSSQPSDHVAMTSFNYPSRNDVLQDYQMQRMLLEQQSKKRLIMARQQLDSMVLPPPHFQPILSGNLHSPLGSNALQNYELQHSALTERNEQRLDEGRQTPVDRVQKSKSGPSQPAPDNQASLPVRRYEEEQPMGARHDQGAFRRRVQPQPLMARDAFAPMLAPMAASPTQPNRHNHPTDHSQSSTGAQSDISDHVPHLDLDMPTQADRR